MPLTIVLHGDPISPQQPRLALALAERGHRVVLVDAPEIAAAVRKRFPSRCLELSSHRGVWPPLRRFLVRIRARMLRASVVHLNYVKDWHDVWIGVLPFVATAWGSDLNDEVFRKPARYSRAIDEVLANAAAVTADSAELLEKARARSRSSQAPFELVRWGVDLGQFDPEKARQGASALRARLGISPDARVLLSPRQTAPHYHVDRIVRAFAESAWAKDGVMVIKLHGRPNEEQYETNLRALARELGVEDRVRFAPPCAYEDVQSTYAMANAAVSALEADGLPSTFCELMALGVPIVATNLAGYEGVLVNEDNALLVPPGDHASLVGALDRLASDRQFAERLVANGKTWVRDNASWQRSVDRWEALYQHAIGAR